MVAVTAGTAGAAPPQVTCPTVDPTTGALNPAPSAGVNWAGCNLTSADFSRANVTGATLSNATLKNANFNGANLTNATLNGADMTGAVLANTNLASASMTGVNLTQAIIKNSSLNKTALAGATLTKVVGRQITGTPASLPANWSIVNGSLVGPGADLSNDDLTGANLSGLNLSGADFDGSNLSNANLTNANVSGASFRNAVVTGADLSGVNLSGDNISGIVSGNVTGNPVLPSGWTLRDGFLIGPGASLAGANLAGLNLSGASLTGINLSNASLVSTNLSNANLSNSNLTGANLTGADLFRANLAGVTWSSTTCPNSKNSTGLNGGCAQQLAYRFGGLTSPAPGSRVSKSAHSFVVRFRLTNFHSQKVTDSIGRSLTSGQEVRVTLTGPGIAQVNTTCTWNASIGKFRCAVHFGNVKKGRSHNYKLKVQENYGLGWAKAPTRPGAANPATIHFR
jgi:uncharacterized protein YjbI with pentapeptide repeats